MNISQILGQLANVRKSGSGWTALCPAHEDKRNSLSITEGSDSRILVKCFAGCIFGDLAAKGWNLSDLFPQSNGNGNGSRKPSPRIVAEYDYPDERGDLLYQNVRYQPKDFRQRRPDGNGGWTWNLDGVRRVPYRLPEVIAASDVLFVEGEKDADSGKALGITSTTSGAVGSWRAEFSEPLRGKRSPSFPMRTHLAGNMGSGSHIACRKSRMGQSARATRAKDLSAWLEREGTREALLDLIHAAPEWTARSVDAARC